MDKSLKTKLLELEERHRFIANSLIDAVWVVDLKTLKFEYITPSIEKISGYAPDEYLGFTIEDRLEPGSYKKVVKMIEEAKKEYSAKKSLEGFKSVEVEVPHKDGYTYWVEIRARLYKKGKDPLKIVGAIRDISELKKAEDENNSLISRLKIVLKEKDKLLSENKVLRGLLPICSGCKRIRDEKGKWWPLDFYVKEHTDAELTHSICPDCTDVFYGKE